MANLSPNLMSSSLSSINVCKVCKIPVNYLESLCWEDQVSPSDAIPFPCCRTVLLLRFSFCLKMKAGADDLHPHIKVKCHLRSHFTFSGKGCNIASFLECFVSKCDQLLFVTCFKMSTNLENDSFKKLHYLTTSVKTAVSCYHYAALLQCFQLFSKQNMPAKLSHLFEDFLLIFGCGCSYWLLS